jgi:S-(hydroxymethyl)glutathione dehydrogenase/alcohol dehydrogenase
MKAKAAILETLNRPLIVDEIEIPAPGPGQVLVRVHCSGICGTQIEEISAERDPHLPHLLGHEGAGTVECIGEGVTRVKMAEPVVMHWRKGAGIESEYPKYIWGNKTIGGGLVTTFNEFALVSENRLTPIPEDTPWDIAALMGCAVTTGLGVVFKEAELKPGESIAVIGCGGVGLNIIQAAAMVSAHPIYAVDMVKDKLTLAWRFGATSSWNLTKGPLDFENVDVVVDCTGDVSLIEMGLELTAPKGCMILVGLPHSSQSSTIQIRNMRQHFTGKKIIFSNGGGTEPNADILHYLNLYRQGRLNLEDLITHRFSLDHINEALAKVQSGDCGRCVVEMP